MLESTILAFKCFNKHLNKIQSKDFKDKIYIKTLNEFHQIKIHILNELSVWSKIKVEAELLQRITALLNHLKQFQIKSDLQMARSVLSSGLGELLLGLDDVILMQLSPEFWQQLTASLIFSIEYAAVLKRIEASQPKLLTGIAWDDFAVLFTHSLPHSQFLVIEKEGWPAQQKNYSFLPEAVLPEIAAIFNNVDADTDEELESSGEVDITKELILHYSSDTLTSAMIEIESKFETHSIPTRITSAQLTCAL